MENRCSNPIKISGFDEGCQTFCRYFKHVQLNGTINIPEENLKLAEIIDFKSEVEIIGANIMSSLKFISSEGQNPAGMKLFVHGRIQNTIEYIGSIFSQSINTFSFSDSFSTYIILDDSFSPDIETEVLPVVEDISVTKVDERKVHYGIMMLLEAKTSGSLQRG